MTIYGHLHFNCFFRELFALSEKGLIFKGKEYEWNKIEKIDRSFGSSLWTILMTGSSLSCATICLKDGKKIRINGRVFTKKGEYPKFGTLGFITYESKAFNDVLDIIEKKLKQRP